ncbi:serine hydroxymethyltransferase [Aerococcus urinaehominis]|uniref:Serine hydroxymethyltransferase n=1 Tax=Aerococcus urinaehominis TaxID=128944 RepID=A0A0X8FK38_9LACT|nr:serine hydroxymethyltransferase [Aerococcus urinaehominis]AMB98759.1 serine hydroxymethyltransferase [Aerococcus urinaehominis]SDM13791.1 glycine hydroxymethyltransferase [Aerococcus urinaehominis]
MARDVIFDLIDKEFDRQNKGIELIASENWVSPAVRQAQGSVLTNKYAEGYPGRRYYGGCQFIDEIEQEAVNRAKKLFGADYVNVQPHSGSQANMAAYNAFLNHGDKILGMDLSHGGHLTHGSKVNFSGKSFDFIAYGVDRETEQIDYNQLAEIARQERPRMIVAGASAYSRVIDFAKISQIAKEIDAFFMVDMAHIAGLVAAGLHPSPLDYADVVTTTTHKTLRGPRGGMILSNNEAYFKKLNSAIFPGIQGGPLEHVIAAKAICFGEALKPEFVDYQKQVIKNAQQMAATLKNQGIAIVSGGTDNHMMLVKVINHGFTGQEVETALDEAGITVNKNTIPFETLSPVKASGIRIGSPAITSRGMAEQEAAQIGQWIGRVVKAADDKTLLADIRHEVSELVAKFPLS